MTVQFYKYEGTGNDFIMIDNRQNFFPKNDIKLIERWCHRRFGIGADGLILLENDAQSDFKMVYYNSDGRESTMCGNGGRCIVAFAKQIGVIDNKARFNAVDGLHEATIQEDGKVSLQMKSVPVVAVNEQYVFLDTGSPHHVTLVQDLENFDVQKNGAAIRYSSLYGAAGSNVNFVSQISENHFRLRTYERGVEDETLSCGTGATATAIAMHVLGKTTSNRIDLDVEGGRLQVAFEKENNTFTQVFLEGPATFVYEGTMTL